MRPISLKLQTSVEQKLRENAQKKDISISEYVRDLIDFGLHFEEANLQEEILRSGKETLFLIRSIVGGLLDKDTDTRRQIEQQCETKSREWVEKYLNKPA